MNLTIIDALDIFLRCSAVGQLILICSIYLRRPVTGGKTALLGVAVCVAAYLLLTAPIPDEHYGALRNILLVFTDALAYSMWFAAMYYFDDSFSPRRWPRPLKAAIALFLVWYVYFFAILEGQGAFHDINHAIAIGLLIHVIYVALRGRNDDLVDRRRSSRILVAILASVYGILIASAEFADSSIRNDWRFSLVNVAFIFLAILLLARSLLGRKADPVQDQMADAYQDQAILAEKAANALPLEFKNLKQKLDVFMDNGGYRQSALTITTLAEQLSCPEHRLRRLINILLGFRNFTAFLNSRRVQDARERLADPNCNSTSVLTLALDLGYGSIGPFNRAFKAETGLTPTEYRHQFQNRL